MSVDRSVRNQATLLLPQKSGHLECPPDDGPDSTGNFSFSWTGARLLSSTSLGTGGTHACVPCKKVWKQKLPWPLGFYGDWSDRTGAPVAAGVYTRVRGSIIPRRCVAEHEVWRAKSLLAGRKASVRNRNAKLGQRQKVAG